MAAIELGRLEKVELRSVFKTEAGAFTPWLATATNLAELGKTIGLELELEAQEKEVGPFRADILCKDALTQDFVLIENQIEKTDHVHLGQLLTYAAGLEAVTIIWIAEKFADQHRAALDWLNSKTTEGIRFFGLEVELWRIGKSEVAPKFNIKSQPNEWSTGIREAAKQAAGSERRQFQFKFWTAFRKFMEDSKSPVRCQKAAPQHSLAHSIGKAGFYLASVISSGKGNPESNGNELRAELVIIGQERFKAVAANKATIEKQLGMKLQWHNPPGQKQCRVYVCKAADFTDEALWPEQHTWLKETLEKFQKVLVPIILGSTIQSSKARL